MVGAQSGTQSPGGQATTYYVQQPMYLDQNGQPIYYRVPGGPFPQEMMYAPNPDGNIVT